MADLYYNAAVDNDLGNALNWWTDPGFSSPAGAVPTAGDNAFVFANASSNTAGLCAPDNLTVSSGTFATTIVCAVSASSLSGAIADTGTNLTAPVISFQAGSSMAGASNFTGNVTGFGGNMVIGSAGTITGDLTFAGSYTDALPTSGIVPTVTGTIFFSGSMTFSGAGNSTSPTWTDSGSTWNFHAQNNSGNFPCGTATFLNGAINTGTITTASGTDFDATSENQGAITGDSEFNGGNANKLGTVSGNGTYNGAYTDVAFFGTTSGTTILGATFTLFTSQDWTTDTSGWSIDGAATFTFNSTSANSGILPRAVFTNASGSNASGTVGDLTVPGTQSGNTITCDWSKTDLGTYTTLTLSGVTAGSPVLGGFV